MENVISISDSVKKKLCDDNRESLYKIEFVTSNGQVIVRGETNLPEAKKELLNKLRGQGINYVDSLTVLPDVSKGSLTWGLVTISVCNMRITPSHDAEMVTQAILGTPVRVLKKESSWYLVQTPDKYISWVDDDAIFRMTDQQFKENKEYTKMVYLPAEGLAMSLETSSVVTDLVAGSILRFIRQNGKNCILSMPDGRLIEVPSSDVMDFEKWSHRDLSVKDLSETALNFMGRPYLWGGTSAKSVDCSGFVKMVYFLNGYILARDASLQFLYGEIISPEQGWQQLREGDLVFFGRSATDDKPAKATHVGYYLGESEFIHSSGYVRVNSFDPERKNYSHYRTISWLGGRRMLPAKSDGIVRVADHPWY